MPAPSGRYEHDTPPTQEGYNHHDTPPPSGIDLHDEPFLWGLSEQQKAAYRTFRLAWTKGNVRMGHNPLAASCARDMFAKVRDNMAHEVLATLALARIDLYPDVDNIPEVMREARAMKTELGLNERSERDVTLGNIMEAVLSGTLQLQKPDMATGEDM